MTIARRSSWLAVLVLVVGCGAAPPSEPRAAAEPRGADRERLELAKLSRSTLTIKVLREAFWGDRTVTNEGMGSGFAVVAGADVSVVTAAHVVDGAVEIVAVDSEGRSSDVLSILAFDPEADVAVLEVGKLAQGVTPVMLGASPKVGEEVMLVSSPLGLSTTVAFGTVAAHRPEAKAFQLDAGVSPGSSGGLVSDKRGRAIGVIRAKGRSELDAESIVLVTPIAFVTTALGRKRPRRLAPRPDARRLAPAERFDVLPTRGALFDGYEGAASARLTSGKRQVEHLCARVDDPMAVVAVAEPAETPAWRQGMGRSCATFPGGVDVVVAIGTSRVGHKLELVIDRQR
jgi:hypothetical protein